VTRRQFVAALIAALPALALPAAAAAASTSRADVRARLFRDRVLDRQPIAAYVDLHLAKHPRDADFGTLLGKVLGGRAGDDAEAMKRHILAGIRQDFEAGRTEILDGWILSLTEVRLWCLYLAVTP